MPLSSVILVVTQLSKDELKFCASQTHIPVSLAVEIKPSYQAVG